MNQTLEIVTDEDVPAEIKTSVTSHYQELSQRASSLLETAIEILSKDTTSDEVAIEARECRLALVKVRTDTERQRKALLRPVDLHRKAISGAAAILTDIVSQKEIALGEVEDAYEKRKEERRLALHKERLSELEAIVQGEALAAYALVDLGTKSKKEFAEIISAARTLAEEAEAKRLAAEAEAQRLAEEAEAARVAAEEEAARLAEAEAAEKASVKAEMERLAAEAEKERAEFAAKQELAETENRVLREKLAALEAEKQAEADKAEAAAEALREEQRRIAAEQLVRAKAERAAALAPDKEKLSVFIQGLASITPPEMATNMGKMAATSCLNILNKARKDMATIAFTLQ